MAMLHQELDPCSLSEIGTITLSTRLMTSTALHRVHNRLWRAGLTDLARTITLDSCVSCLTVSKISGATDSHAITPWMARCRHEKMERAAAALAHVVEPAAQGDELANMFTDFIDVCNGSVRNQS